MAPTNIKISAQQRRDLRDGFPITINYQDQNIRVAPFQIAHARNQYLAGLPVFILAEVVGGGMTEISVT